MQLAMATDSVKQTSVKCAKAAWVTSLGGVVQCKSPTFFFYLGLHGSDVEITHLGHSENSNKSVSCSVGLQNVKARYCHAHMKWIIGPLTAKMGLVKIFRSSRIQCSRSKYLAGLNCIHFSLDREF